MRLSVYCLILAGAGVQLAARAQSPSPGFAGVYVAAPYVAVPEVFEPEAYPFTEAGKRDFDRFDAFAARNQANDCALAPMPSVIFNGDPMEILDEGDALIFHYERSDIRRAVHMDGRSAPADEPHTALGYSVGRYVGNDEIVIETTHLLDGAIRVNEGHPMSADARAIERYRRAPGERNLSVELVVHDPVNYTEPVRLGRDLVWAPDDEVLEWGCIDLGPKDEAPDIDELVRILEQAE